MKDQWKMWKALKGNETGLGWNPIKGTVVAPDEWWNEKIKENSNFARFREKGIGQEFYENYQELFLGTVATGEFAYAPSSGVLPNETQETQQFDIADHVEENINAESNFDDDLNEMMNAGFGSGGSFSQAVSENVGLENTKNDNSQHNVQKQKRKELSNDLATKKKKDNRGKKVSGAIQMTDTVKELKETIKETMESKTATMCSLLGDRPGWEGTAHDGRLFQYAINKQNLNFPKPPPGKYYVVDAGYQQMEGYLAPYKGTRYHLPDFQRGGRPIGLKEIFNRWHSSLRCCIERTFGVWKARWKILRTISPYSFYVQRDIVVVSMALHNYIRRKALADPAFEQLDKSPNFIPPDIFRDVDDIQAEESSQESGALQMNALRDQIACSLMLANNDY
ncbi:hypothetical protein GH714_003484 [Hevea brasiliensis]|uniref:DDE Tnp4 domain-containing protein n=1 Tax=Hevea brasiliensis TaxID=3981 RepID=A0A6A6LJJ4_HEVBR|nr:hypothetical protein GH714_003484 [Hevea brasiliensis]